MNSPDSISQAAARQAELRRMRTEALKLAAFGLEVFPLHRISNYTPLICGCGNLECANAGKHPAVDAWPAVKTVDEKKVRALWFDIPYSGIAIATGKGSNVWVLDVDTKNSGFETLAELEAKHAPLPRTVTALTGSGGKHFYFAYPGPEYRNTAGKLGKGIDTRGDGGLVVAPPSPHKSGNAYSWEIAPGEVPFAPVPEWLLEILRTEAPAPKAPTPSDAADSVYWPPPSLELARAQLLTMVNHPLVRWASENPNDVTQGLWWALCRNFTTLAVDCPEILEEVSEAFQAMSEGHRSYSRPATQKLFARCLQEKGPLSFHAMVQNGAPGDLMSAVDGRDLISYARRNAVVAPAAKPSKPSAPPAARASAPAAPPSAAAAPAPTTALAKAVATTAFTPGKAGRPKIPLKFGEWDDEAEERFYFDVARRGYRYIKSQNDPDDPGGLSELFSKQGICQVITSDYGMPFKSAQALVDGIRKMGEPIVDPSKPYGIVQRGDLFSFNRFIGGNVVPAKGYWGTIRRLMLNLTGGEIEDMEYILDWLAAPLQALYHQRKLLKLRTAIVFHGLEGAGKNTLVRLMALFYGEKNVATINQNTISGRFQGIMEYKLFISANEVRPRDDGSDDRLKELITDRRLMMERKGVEAYECDNLANFIFSSNRDRPVHAGDGDRRYSIFHTGPKASNLGALIHADIETSQVETAAFLYELLHRTITHDVNEPYVNAARAAVQSQNLSPAQAFVSEVREFGFQSVGQPWLKQRSDDPSRSLRLTEDSNDVEYNTLFEVYGSWLRSNRFKGGGGRNKDVLAQFRKAGLIGESKRRTVNGIKYTYFEGIPFGPEGDPDEAPPVQPPPEAPPEAKKNDDPFGD